MRGRTILVVDDDEAVRDMVAEYLTSRGFEVVEADGSKAMRAALADHLVDLVLLDRTMPCGDGLRLVPELQHGHNVSVIVVTALGQDDERILGLETGADDYICKPFNMRELVARIETVLRRASARPEGRGEKSAPATGDRPSLQRRQAAVLCADVEGYVRLMRADEEGTMRNWWMYRHTIIDPAIRAHSGRLAKLTGDGFLAEFATAEEAVHCAQAIQGGVERMNARLAADRRMYFRMGVNWCWVIADREDIYGEGVNLAARLQSIAEPGGICISEAVRANLTGTDAWHLVALAPRCLKNIDEPVNVYRVVRSSGC